MPNRQTQHKENTVVNIEYLSISSENHIRLIVKGHAGQAEQGKDIVCSAVSILTYTIAENIQRLCKNHIGFISLEEGASEVDVFFNSDKEFKEIGGKIEAIVTGFEILSKAYPEYVTFNTDGNGESLNI